MNEAEALFQANPFAAVKFLRPLLLFGSVISSVLTVLTFRELREQPHWWTEEGRAVLRLASEGGGDEGSPPQSLLPLVWVWLQFTIMCVQWPIRLLLLRHILQLGTGTVNEAAAQLTGLARSRAWRGNQHLGGLHAVVCLVGACIYFFCAQRGSSLGRLVLVHVVTFFVRSVVTFSWFAISFAWELPAGQVFPSPSSLQFKARQYVADLPVVAYRPAEEEASSAAAPARPPATPATPAPAAAEIASASASASAAARAEPAAPPATREPSSPLCQPARAQLREGRHGADAASAGGGGAGGGVMASSSPGAVERRYCAAVRFTLSSCVVCLGDYEQGEELKVTSSPDQQHLPPLLTPSPPQRCPPRSFRSVRACSHAWLARTPPWLANARPTF